MEAAQLERNRRTQAGLYGQDLRGLFGHLVKVLGLTQTQLAITIGVSAPMLSQLMSAHRVKIGNPAVVQRVQVLTSLADDVEAGRVTRDELAVRLDDARTLSGIIARSTTGPAARDGATDAVPAAAVVAAVRHLLRAVASGRELEEVAETLSSGHPGLAELIRVYGVGPHDEAMAHYDRHAHLV